jgi:hypothetical protein
METTVRYFVYAADLDHLDDLDPITEVSEREFIAYDGVIHYERHTVFQNGVAQICLTKGLDVC